MNKALLIAAGGALGALGRAGLTALAQRWLGAGFPYGTLAVNLVGCLLFGLVWALTEGIAHDTTEIRLLVLTGFMGALTTFSTYAFDSAQLWQGGRILAFAANLAFQNLLGLACVFLGFALGRLV
jgi:CrcB protein